MSKAKVTRIQTPRERVVSASLQQIMASHGFVGFELVLQQEHRILYNNAIARLLSDLAPIAARELHRYGLGRPEHVDDAVQRIVLKLQEGRCLKNYKAGETVPRVYLLGCAPNYARTIARSIWREAKRYCTNCDWRSDQ